VPEGSQHLADVIILQLDAQDRAPWGRIQAIKEEAPDSKILVLGSSPEREELIKCLRAGAAGYIEPVPSEESLLKALKLLEKGGAPLSNAAARTLVSSFQPSRETPLSVRETEVLTLLSKGKTYSLIANELFVSGETVRSHIRNIYKKLRVKSKAEAIATAHKKRLLVNLPQVGGWNGGAGGRVLV
jgi:DNA-binding NarL/FixJ family response regulator